MTDSERELRELARRKLGTTAVSTVLGLMFWATAISLFFAPGRDFIFKWWWAFLIAGAAIVMFGLLWQPGRQALKEATSATRATLFVVVVLPLLIAIIAAPFVLLTDWNSARVLRGVFLFVASFMPAMMWYLFIVTRKASLFNEFVANLDRLGLLEESMVRKDGSPRDHRIESYLQRFEAIYGDLPDATHSDVLNGTFRRYPRNDTARTITLSTAMFSVGLFTILVAIGWLITLPPFDLRPVITQSSAVTPDTNTVSPWTAAFVPTITPITLAFLGAYFFSLQMIFRRYVRKDLGGSAYVSASIRIILALIGIWTVQAIGSAAISGGEATDNATWYSWDTQLLVLGFVFGVFPRVIWQILRAVFVKITKAALPNMESQLPLSDLDGFTVWHESRLEEEGIENIPNMANADLVELLLNTRLSSEQIIDWVDQAILYMQLGPQGKKQGAREKLLTYGIRTATSLLWAYEESNRGRTNDAFENILTDSNGPSVVRTLVDTLVINTNVRLIDRWRRYPVDLVHRTEQPIAA